jgi:uncharacterized membrane protein
MSSRVTDKSIERGISVLLRTGVALSGLIVLAGGIYYLAAHAGDATDYGVFKGQPVEHRAIGQIIAGAFALRAQSVIQLGILALIATPILRVAFSLVGFAIERDGKYVAISSVVLALLLCSLIYWS